MVIEHASPVQRWRQFHMKKTFSHELKWASERCRRNDASLAMLEQERAQRERDLTCTLVAQHEIEELQFHAAETAEASAQQEVLPPPTVVCETCSKSSEKQGGAPLISREELVWINEAQARALGYQNVSVATHHLRRLVAEIKNLKHVAAGDLVTLSEVHEAIINIERDLNEKINRGRVVHHQAGRGPVYSGWACQSARRSKPGIESVAVWKWRWALAVTKSRTASRHLKSLGALYKATMSEEQAQQVEAEASSENVYSSDAAKLRNVEKMEKQLMSIVPRYSLVSLAVGLWRAYSSCTETQKASLSRLIPIDRMLAAFPLWVEKVRDRKIRLYFFSLWQRVAIRKNRESSRQKRQAGGHSIYEPFYHCCYSSDSARCRSKHCDGLSNKDEQGDECGGGDERCMASHEVAANAAAAADAAADKYQDGVNNVEDVLATYTSSPAPLVITSDKVSCQVTESFPVHHSGHSTFSAQALRRMQLQLQQELQNMQPILARAAKTVQNQVLVDQHGNAFQDPRRTTSMAALWKICSTVEYALTEARNQMLSIIQESARGGCDYDELIAGDVMDATGAAGAAGFEATEKEAAAAVAPHHDRHGRTMQSVFHFLNTNVVRRRSCLAAQHSSRMSKQWQY